MGPALAILPIFLVIAAGYGIVASRLMPAIDWPGIEKLTFRVLIPAVLIEALVRADLSLSRIGPLALAFLASLAIAVLLLLALRWVVSQERLPNPRYTTVFQTVSRWNVFVALACSDLIVGPEGRALVAVGISILVPLINVTNILVLASFGPESRRPTQVARAVATNPLVIGCAVGLSLNLSGIAIPEPAAVALGIVGDGALGVGLLAIGAGVSLHRLASSAPEMWAGVILRLIASPLLFLAVAAVLDLPPDQTFLGALVMMVPAATNGYVVAKQMGGDADLYADILMWQTVLSMVTIPVLAIVLI